MERAVLSPRSAPNSKALNWVLKETRRTNYVISFHVGMTQIARKHGTPEPSDQNRDTGPLRTYWPPVRNRADP